MIGRLTGAHCALATAQVGLAVGVHGSLVRLPSPWVLGLLGILMTATVLVPRVSHWRRRRRAFAAEQTTMHLLLLAVPLLLGDGLHLNASHSWWQFVLVGGYATMLASMRRVSTSLELELACQFWRALKRRPSPVVAVLESRTPAREVGPSRRPGCAAARPLLSAAWFRGPPAGRAVIA